MYIYVHVYIYMHIQVKQGDIIMAVDEIPVTRATVDNVFSSNKYIGSCASIMLKRASGRISQKSPCCPIECVHTRWS